MKLNSVAVNRSAKMMVKGKCCKEAEAATKGKCQQQYEDELMQIYLCNDSRSSGNHTILNPLILKSMSKR